MNETTELLKSVSNIEFTVEGDLMRAERVFSRLSSKSKPLVRDAARGGRRFLERLKWTLIKGIVTNGGYVGLMWPPVTDKYAAFKMRTFGLPGSTMLQASQNYIHALLDMDIVQSNYVTQLKFKRGALDRKSHPKGIALRHYIQVNEEGGLRSQARPLWGPAFRKLGGYEGCKNEVLSGIKSRLKKEGLNIS
jgi:hypothetical protein